MDEIDLANDMAERILKASINAARGIPLVIEGNGYCLNCGDEVDVYDGVIPRWCDFDCRNDWSRR